MVETRSARLPVAPRRKGNYDFLDSLRTAAPCGVPKGSAPLYTTFRRGQSITVVFTLTFAHNGSVQVNLLNGDGSFNQRLHTENWLLKEDPTKNDLQVTLPNKPCSNCIIQLKHMAYEWGPNYIFHSCADVHILTSPGMQCPAVYDKPCSGHGRCESSAGAGRCTCERTYSGNVCQFKGECVNDADYGGTTKGKCLSGDTINYPKDNASAKKAGWERIVQTSHS